jgi:hypothetical protein
MWHASTGCRANCSSPGGEVTLEFSNPAGGRGMQRVILKKGGGGGHKASNMPLIPQDYETDRDEKSGESILPASDH